VVDWQTVGAGPPLLDVAYLLGTGLDPDERGANEERLVHTYHDAVVAAGVRGYDWSQCWEDYRRYAAYAVIMLVTAAVIVERTERGDAMFLSMIGRAAAQIADLDALDVIAG
jgi:aminoglycoside phosphotransferase (APT) family kinase protein